MEPIEPFPWRSVCTVGDKREAKSQLPKKHPRKAGLKGGGGAGMPSRLAPNTPSISFFSLFEDREAHDARIIGRGYAFGCRVAERPVALPPQTMEGACPRSTSITSTLEIASGGPPGPGPRSSDSNS